MNPKLSEFFWIKIYIYWNDHNLPHFHVKYKDYNCYIWINDIRVLEWKLPKKITKLVLSWAEIYKKELKTAWGDAQKNENT